MKISKLLLVSLFVPACVTGQELSYIGRMGLYDATGGNEFTRSGGFTSSVAQGLTDTGYVRGNSNRYMGGSLQLGVATWIGKPAGSAARTGLYGTGGGNEFTSNAGAQSGTSLAMNRNGDSIGTSVRYKGGSATLGGAAWVADASGTTARIGFFDTGNSGPYTSSTGAQTSTPGKINQAGKVLGFSQRYDAGVYKGIAAWVAVKTGTTTRIGLFDQGGGNEFTGNTGFQASGGEEITDSGYVAGVSFRYNGSATSKGDAVWVVDPAGTTRRVGLYDQNGGTEFTLNGSQTSGYFKIIESGHVSGTSLRLGTGTGTSQAVWVADSAGTTRRVGLWGQGGGNEFTSDSNYQFSKIDEMVASGYQRGSSSRYNGGAAYRGNAAWMATREGVTFRLGFYDQNGGNEFSNQDGYRRSEVVFLKESGRTTGLSDRYKGADPFLGYAAWTADSTGTTVRVGFYDQAGGNTFTGSDGYQRSNVYGVTESGMMTGSSERYDGGTEYMGDVAWVAPATGALTRIGLYDQAGGNEFTRADSAQISLPAGISETGVTHGSSGRYNGGGTYLGEATWVANAGGTTTRTGIQDALHTRDDGFQDSETKILTNQGLCAGFTLRYNGSSSEVGQTAWIHNTATGSQVVFNLSTRTSNGYGFSKVNGITADGLAHGTFEKYNGNTNLGTYAFIWSAATGTILFDGSNPGILVPRGWNNLTVIDFATPGGWFAAKGQPVSPAGGQGISLWRVSAPASGGGFSDWAELASLPANQRGANDTPAGDGVANLVKYALGGTPLTSAATRLPRMIAPQSGPGGNHPAIQYIRSRNAPGVSITVQVSTSMNFSVDLGHTTVTQEDLGDGTDMVTVRSNAALTQHAKQFFRLKVGMVP